MGVEWAFFISFSSEYRIRTLASADVAGTMLIEIFFPAIETEILIVILRHFC